MLNMTMFVCIFFFVTEKKSYTENRRSHLVDFCCCFLCDFLKTKGFYS